MACTRVMMRLCAGDDEVVYWHEGDDEVCTGTSEGDDEVVRWHAQG